jgi:hypothetical protein
VNKALEEMLAMGNKLVVKETNQNSMLDLDELLGLSAEKKEEKKEPLAIEQAPPVQPHYP